MKILGDYSSQKIRENSPGYNSNTWGLIIGADKQYSDSLLGVSFAYNNTYLKISDGLGSSDIDSFQFSGYGSYNFNENLFMQGQASYILGHNNNDRISDPQANPSSLSSSNNFTSQFAANIQEGYDINVSKSMVVTPMLTNYFGYYYGESYIENGSSPNNISLGTTSLWFYDIGAGMKFNWNIPIGDYGDLAPSLFLGYSYALSNPSVSNEVTLVSGSDTFTMNGYAPGRSSYLLDIGMTFSMINNLEISMDYSLNIKKEYKSQSGSLNMSYRFK
jgi:outer membrane autotransporter protein